MKIDDAVRNKYYLAVLLAIAAAGASPAFAATSSTVDFRYAPPEWQTAICLPDDPFKSLVDRSGELLYQYNQGGREFGTRVGVEVIDAAVWERQELLSPHVPIIRTSRSAAGLKILEEAFAVTDLPQVSVLPSVLQRLDAGGVNRDWAKPPAPPRCITPAHRRPHGRQHQLRIGRAVRGIAARGPRVVRRLVE